MNVANQVFFVIVVGLPFFAGSALYIRSKKLSRDEERARRHRHKINIIGSDDPE